MNQATALLGLLTETSLHAGAGRMVGVIDLPIQREAHSGWPCVYGSAVKGALRTRAEGESWVSDVFGPDTQNASDHAGALLVTDARLLLLPVRSLTTHFKWVTCPALLRRFAADCRRLGLEAPGEIPEVEREEALVPRLPEGGGLGTDLFLEQFRFQSRQHDLTALVASIARLLAQEGAADALLRQLTVIHDDLFALLARFATPVAAHVRLQNETRTVAPGALWYEESLPPDTLLYVGLIAAPSRRQDARKGSAEVLGHVATDLFGAGHDYLQLGGNETVGMGWCRVRLLPGQGSGTEA